MRKRTPLFQENGHPQHKITKTNSCIEPASATTSQFILHRLTHHQATLGHRPIWLQLRQGHPLVPCSRNPAIQGDTAQEGHFHLLAHDLRAPRGGREDALRMAAGGAAVSTPEALKTTGIHLLKRSGNGVTCGVFWKCLIWWGKGTRQARHSIHKDFKRYNLQ